MILYFSGTGNSRYIAQSLANYIGDEALDVTQQAGKQLPDEAYESMRPFIFVSPTYAWRIPRVFENWLRRCRFSSNKKAYFVMTCGTDIGDAGHYLGRLCREIGLDYGGTAAVVMPENYIAMFDIPDETTAERLIKVATRRTLPSVAHTILAEGTLISPHGGISGWLKSHPVNPLFYTFCVHDRRFYTTDACIGCGKCAAVCPLENITLQEGKPVWGGNCTHCMACICDCPAEAIEYGKISLGKRRYRNELPPAEKQL